jgi:hypothetical protein
LSQNCTDLSSFCTWPLLPTKEGYLTKLNKESKVLRQSDALPDQIRNLLLKVGCKRLDSDAIGVEYPLLQQYTQPSSANGTLLAIYYAAQKNTEKISQLFAGALADEREAYRLFLAQFNWKSLEGMVTRNSELMVKRYEIRGFNTTGVTYI